MAFVFWLMFFAAFLSAVHALSEKEGGKKEVIKTVLTIVTIVIILPFMIGVWVYFKIM